MAGDIARSVDLGDLHRYLRLSLKTRGGHGFDSGFRKVCIGGDYEAVVLRAGGRRCYHVIWRMNWNRLSRGVVEVIFSDTGSGISAHFLPRIFDPFFTMKPEGQGTGPGAFDYLWDHQGASWWYLSRKRSRGRHEICDPIPHCVAGPRLTTLKRHSQFASWRWESSSAISMQSSAASLILVAFQRNCEASACWRSRTAMLRSIQTSMSSECAVQQS